jgi:hypothetical protein
MEDKILWLEDQHEDFDAYKSALFRSGYLVDEVKSVSEAEKKLREEDYLAVIFDIKVLPGDEPKWMELDETKRKDNPHFDSYLGMELLYSLFNSSKASVSIDPPISIDPGRIIVFSVVYDKAEEISALGIPEDQIIYKSSSDLFTLPKLIVKIRDNFK